ncbi:hypothetical protein SOP93_13950 [Peribacillus frigoritolerans]|uniref:hypothetical protein n=1 Tax=Peribacillus frigoritolerans TaxID=450367 RepID=UPI002B24750E|nr:hypothetical protein [Peribacillus frigoritolerans]MEB2492267.1 hypothetical protein [Peribacillus frigoritolerans]
MCRGKGFGVRMGGMDYSCNPHGKRLATLLSNYWLAETPQAERDFKGKLIGTGVRDSGGKSASKGDPTGANAEGGPPAESECLEWKSTSTKERQSISEIN